MYRPVRGRSFEVLWRGGKIILGNSLTASIKARDSSFELEMAFKDIQTRREYSRTDRVKAMNKAYIQSDKGKAVKEAYNQSGKAKAAQQKSNNLTRGRHGAKLITLLFQQNHALGPMAMTFTS